MVLWLIIFAFGIPLIYAIVEMTKEKDSREKRLIEIQNNLSDSKRLKRQMQLTMTTK